MPTDWQWHYLERDHQELTTNAGTLRIKLPQREQISVIELEWRITQHATDFAKTFGALQAIDKIEVIADGATVLYSMSPETGSYIEYCRQKKMPAIDFYMCASGPEKVRLKIMFGRHMRDEKFMLDTSVYNNVYLEVPWDISGAGYTDYSFMYTVRYLRPMEKLSPEGFLRSRDIEYGAHNWTATGHHYVDLPLKYPWYRIGCQILNSDELMHIDMPHIRLDIDDGRYVLVDSDTDDLRTVEDERQCYPVTTSYHHVDGDAAAWRQLYTYMGYPNEANSAMIDNAASGVLFYAGYGYEAWVAWLNDAEARVDNSFVLHFMGENYMACQTIKDWENTEPFDVDAHSEAEIDFTHAIVNMEDLRIFLTEVCPLKIGGAP